MCAAPFGTFFKPHMPAGLRKIISPMVSVSISRTDSVHLIWGKAKIKSVGVLYKSKCAHMHTGLAGSDKHLQIFLCSLKFNRDGLQNPSYRIALLRGGWGDSGGGTSNPLTLKFTGGREGKNLYFCRGWGKDLSKSLP